MLRRTLLLLLSALTVSGVGCAMCCGPNLFTYPTYGGRVQRSDLEYGRVGSIFSDPGADVGMYSEAAPRPSTESTAGSPTPTRLDENEPRRLGPAQKPPSSGARRPRATDSWR
jgi:hypothetical protein